MSSLVLIRRHARLASGLIMLTYVACHLLNHALGLVSLAAMEAMLRVGTTFWKSTVGCTALYGALAIHFALALTALFQRRSLRMSPADTAQMLLGFALPFLGAQHVVNTRVGGWLLGSDLNYAWEVYSYWVLNFSGGILQLTLLSCAWLHAMVGLHARLKLKPWYPQVKMPVFALALLWPVLAALGFAEAGHEVGRLATDPAWVAAARAAAHAPSMAEQQMLYRIRDGVWVAEIALILLVLAARWLRWHWQMRLGVVRVVYPDERVIEVPLGTSVLEASRIGGVAHASICGGRGRCSTCRVRVMEADCPLPEPTEHELKVLRRISAPPNVRLACQLKPMGTLCIMPLLPPTATARDGFARTLNAQGTEREIAVLFADLRGFTQLSEHKLPYDVVFMLNRYFAEMGRAIEEAGGRVDKFIGDGVMALFGLNCPLDVACRQAIAAVAQMSVRLDELNRLLKEDLSRPLRIGIGLNAGPAIVGEMGFGSAVTMTAIGDTVNTASRLEAQCKALECELIMAESVAKGARISVEGLARHEMAVRGRESSIVAYAVKDARSCAARLDLRDRWGAQIEAEAHS
ncbi:MAG: adenylate/guanylate cyclase domain-containing protein [Burkholderiales bacterium]|nr:adenylate/guanylate cyclase domain-containing protein [Burkholderiales bacterium]